MENPEDNRKILIEQLYLPIDASNETIKERIEECKDRELIRLLSIFWKDTKSRFCYEYKISETSFSRWTNHKRNGCLSCIKAVRTHLINISNNVAISNRLKPFNFVITAALKTKAPPNHYNYTKDWDILQRKLLLLENLQLVIFLDADQAVNECRDISWLFNLQDEFCGVHLLAFSGSMTNIPHYWEIDSKWCSWVRSPNQERDSADLVIAMSTKELHNAEIRLKNAAKLKYLIVSNEYFSSKLADILRQLSPKRETFYIKHNLVKLCLVVLSYIIRYELVVKLSNIGNKVIEYLKIRTRNIKNNIGSNEEQTKSYIELLKLPSDSVANIITPQNLLILDEFILNDMKNDSVYIGKRKAEDINPNDQLDNIEELRNIKKWLIERNIVTLNFIDQQLTLSKDVKQYFKITSWNELIKNLLVTRYLDCELHSDARGVFLLRRDTSISKEEDSYIERLRLFFLRMWKGSIEHFCILYKYDKNKFIQFIQNKTTDPGSCEVIQKWINSYY